MIATVGLLVVVAGVSGFALWSSQSTAASARDAVRTSRVADEYARAADAVATEESLERKYRLEPSPQVRVRFLTASRDLRAALEDLLRDADPSSREAAARALRLHAPYLEAVTNLFAAVDRGDLAGAQRIDDRAADPRFEVIQGVVDSEAEDHHEKALAALGRLQRLESFTSWATPVVFLAGLLLVAMFVSVLRRVQRQLDCERRRAVHASEHDALTGLPNRSLLGRRFEAALRESAARADEGADPPRTGLLLVDLDRFKEINDTLGHHYGDELLVQVGPRMAEAVGGRGMVARLGGDEFAVLLPDVGGVDRAVELARWVRAALVEPFRVEDVDLDVEASVGVVVSGEHGEDAASLLQRADVAMYVAKEYGTGVTVYDPRADGHSPQRLALLGELRRGLDRGELVLHYQPKVSVSSGMVVGAEALVRWDHPGLGLLPPGQFVPVAERTGLIGPLTRYVLDAALTQVRSWSDRGYRIPVAVNLSARNLLDEDFPEQVTRLLDRHGVAASLLQLEVTESAIMTEPARAAQLLRRLRERGVLIAIDDFGAGYTSLAQLTTLPVSELKVDRSFVATMDSDPANALIVRSVIDLGHNLGLRVLAEGVETPVALAGLARLGCDLAQGYHFSRPLPGPQFLAWCSARSASAPEPGTAPPPAPAPPVPRQPGAAPDGSVAAVTSDTARDGRGS